jgi:hypothetical protein
MIFWYLIIVIGFCAPFFIKYNPRFYIATLAVVISADVNGLQIFGRVFTGFSFFMLSHYVVFFLNKKYNIIGFVKYVCKQFKSRGFSFLFYSLVITLFVGAYEFLTWKAINFLLIIKPLIMILQALLIGYFLNSNKTKIGKLPISASIALYVSLFNLAVILFQVYGYQWSLPVHSTTYGLEEIRLSGDGSRAYGLSREPAHLVVLQMACLFACINMKFFFKAMITALWVCIAFLTDARSLMLGILILLISFAIFERNKLSVKHIVTILIALCGGYLLVNNERFHSILSITSDESTMIRYGLILSNFYSYIINPFSFFGLNNGVNLFCNSSEDILDLSTFICNYEDAILNWTSNFLTSIPYFILFIYTLFYFLISNFRDRLFIISIMYSGLIFYIWSFPGVCLLTLMIAIINKPIAEST